MFSHVLEASLPFGNVKVSITEPRVAVTGRAAPRSLRHVVVEMNIDLLLLELGGDGIVNLGTVSISYSYTI